MPAATMMTNTGSDNLNEGFGNGLSLYDEYEINMKDGDKLSEYETVRFELIELYTEYAPHKLKNVDKMLSKYQGQEIELLNAAKSKYVPNSDNGHNNENVIQPSPKDSSPTGSSSRTRRQRRSSLGGYLIKGGDLTHSSSSHSISSASSASSAGRSVGGHSTGGGERSSNRRVGRRGSIGGSRSHPDSLSSLSHGNHHHNPRTSTSSRQRRASIGGGGVAAADRRTSNRRKLQRESIQKALDVAMQQDNDEDMSEHSNATDCSGPSISRSTSRSSTTTTRRRGSLGGLDVSGHSKSSSTEYQLSPKSSRKSSRPSATTTHRRRGSSSGLDASEHSKSSLTEQQPSSNNNKPPSSHHRSSRTHRRSSIGGCGGGGGGARRRGSISCTNETWDIQVGTIDDSKAIHKVALRF